MLSSDEYYSDDEERDDDGLMVVDGSEDEDEDELFEGEDQQLMVFFHEGAEDSEGEEIDYPDEEEEEGFYWEDFSADLLNLSYDFIATRLVFWERYSGKEPVDAFDESSVVLASRFLEYIDSNYPEGQAFLSDFLEHFSGYAVRFIQEIMTQILVMQKSESVERSLRGVLHFIYQENLEIIQPQLLVDASICAAEHGQVWGLAVMHAEGFLPLENRRNLLSYALGAHQPETAKYLLEEIGVPLNAATAAHYADRYYAITGSPALEAIIPLLRALGGNNNASLTEEEQERLPHCKVYASTRSAIEQAIYNGQYTLMLQLLTSGHTNRMEVASLLRKHAPVVERFLINVIQLMHQEDKAAAIAGIRGEIGLGQSLIDSALFWVELGHILSIWHLSLPVKDLAIRCFKTAVRLTDQHLDIPQMRELSTNAHLEMAHLGLSEVRAPSKGGVAKRKRARRREENVNFHLLACDPASDESGLSGELRKAMFKAYIHDGRLELLTPAIEKDLEKLEGSYRDPKKAFLVLQKLRAKKRRETKEEAGIGSRHAKKMKAAKSVRR